VAWQGLLRLSTRLIRELDADLVRAHQLPHSSYDVMIQLALAPDRRLRMTELAREVLMSPSGLTRIVDQLEREGLVARERREDDARSFDVVLTEEGRRRLRAANVTHLERVRERFLDRLSDEQLEQLAGVWAAIEPDASPPRR
jgi:DNA-binding MarR family transcriptional regulator